MIVDALRDTPLLNLPKGFASSLDFRLGVEIPDSSRESRIIILLFHWKEVFKSLLFILLMFYFLGIFITNCIIGLGDFISHIDVVDYINLDYHLYL